MRLFNTVLVLMVFGCASNKVLDESGESLDPMVGKILTARAYIAASYDEVWNSFTQASAYETWSSSPCLEFGSSPGDRVAWGTSRLGEPGERLVYQGTVEEIVKGRGLTHTFQFVDFGFEEPPSPIEIQISKHGETVLVVLRHDCTRAPKTAAMISEVGWLKSLSRLKTLLETGQPMPWPENPTAEGP